MSSRPQVKIEHDIGGPINMNDGLGEHHGVTAHHNNRIFTADDAKKNKDDRRQRKALKRAQAALGDTATNAPVSSSTIGTRASQPDTADTLSLARDVKPRLDCDGNIVMPQMADSQLPLPNDGPGATRAANKVTRKKSAPAKSKKAKSKSAKKKAAESKMPYDSEKVAAFLLASSRAVSRVGQMMHNSNRRHHAALTDIKRNFNKAIDELISISLK